MPEAIQDAPAREPFSHSHSAQVVGTFSRCFAGHAFEILVHSQGASGACVQNLNLALGFPEARREML